MTWARDAITAQLNEYAALNEADERVPGHTPDSPRFWFFGLARSVPTDGLDLSDAARRMLAYCSDPDCACCAADCPSLCSNRTIVRPGVAA